MVNANNADIILLCILISFIAAIKRRISVPIVKKLYVSNVNSKEVQGSM